MLYQLYVGDVFFGNYPSEEARDEACFVLESRGIYTYTMRNVPEGEEE